MTHAAVKYDEQGEPIEDERGRPVYRTRKHDIEEFAAIVERYGLWTADLERFALALQRASLDPFEPCDKCRAMPGWQMVIDGGTSRMARCDCYRQWAAQRHAWLSEQPVGAEA